MIYLYTHIGPPVKDEPKQDLSKATCGDIIFERNLELDFRLVRQLSNIGAPPLWLRSGVVIRLVCLPDCALLSKLSNPIDP